MRVLVTGSEGFIGRHVVRALQERGHQVWELDRAHPVHPQELMEADLRQYPCEAIVHLAATVAVADCEGDAAENWRQNVLLTQKVARHAAEVGAKVVFSSSAAVYGAAEGAVDEGSPTRPLGNYGLAKLLSEQVVQAWCARWVILRYFNVFGAGQRQGLHALLERAGESFVIDGDGEQTRDFIAVGRVAKLTVDAVERAENGVYNVCSGKSVSVNEVVAKQRPELVIVFGPTRAGEVRNSKGKARDLFF